MARRKGEIVRRQGVRMLLAGFAAFPAVLVNGLARNAPARFTAQFAGRGESRVRRYFACRIRIVFCNCLGATDG
jgi:hypothetical protein